MGIECPTCNQHGAYVQAITALGETAKKPSDIIAYKLSCGHVVGNKDYMAYRAKIADAEADAAEAKRKIDEKLKSQKTALWASIIAPTPEV